MSRAETVGQTIAGRCDYRLDVQVHTDRSIVWLATQTTGPEAGLRAIVKCINPNGSAPAPGRPEDAILREHHVLQRLQDVGGIPRVLELIDPPGDRDAKLVLSHVDGSSLEQVWCETSAVPRESWRERIRHLPALARLLLRIRERGWIQGDLTPRHVHVKGDEVGLIDFSHAIERGSRPTVFQGTPPWYVPELIAGSPRPVDPERAEAYVFGLMLHHALTGEHVHPMIKQSLAELQAVPTSYWRTTRPRMELLPPDVSPPLQQLVRGLLEPDPALRRALDAAAIEVLTEELESHRRMLFQPTAIDLCLPPGSTKRASLGLFANPPAALDGFAVIATSSSPAHLRAAVEGSELVLCAAQDAAGRTVTVRLRAQEGHFHVDECMLVVHVEAAKPAGRPRRWWPPWAKGTGA